jgi:hypothetical protein
VNFETYITALHKYTFRRLWYMRRATIRNITTAAGTFTLPAFDANMVLPSGRFLHANSLFSFGIHYMLSHPDDFTVSMMVS